MINSRLVALCLVAAMASSYSTVRSEPAGRTMGGRDKSRDHQSVAGPSEPINRAIAAGATATITLQPVQPKTVPASSYPPGSSIVGQTLALGSVPARVWLEAQVTGWAPEHLDLIQLAVDAEDLDGDGGGYDGDQADCIGSPSTGAGDIAPAMQACDVNADCRATMSGITLPCAVGEPSRCLTWTGVSPGDYFPPGKWCVPSFQDACDPRWLGKGIETGYAVDISSPNSRMGLNAKPGEVPLDFAPSYFGTLVLDVPPNAKGSYRIDFDQNQVILTNPMLNDIPIAALIQPVIQIPCGSCCTNFSTSNDCTDGLSEAECNALPTTDTRVFRVGTTCAEAQCCNCTTVMDCQDNNVCTVDACVEACFCANTPVAGWNPATECCDPMSGVQSLIPQSTPCRIGGCSNGGSSGSPMYTNITDGTSCISQDRCDQAGQCASGVCDAEEYAGSNCPKSRFISFDVGSLNEPMAYRVRFVSLHHPVPPYSGGLASDFSAFEGEYRWVGDATSYVESTTNPAEVYSAELVCDPFYRDWSGIDLLHVTGSAVVPSSEYEVQSIIQGLDINEESNYSAPITVVTSRWSDVVYPYNPPSTTVQPDATDITALADKFRSLVGSISKPRALLAGAGMSDVPELVLDVNFAEISACLDAFRGRPYPYGGPTPCP